MSQQEMIQAVKDYAKEHYETGGWDYVVEAYDDQDIAKAIEGCQDAGQAIAKMRSEVGARDDVRKDILAEADNDLASELARLREENARLRSNASRKLTLKVSAKGAVSLYGMGRFPVTLYAEQWDKVFAAQDEVKGFIRDNRRQLAVKPAK